MRVLFIVDARSPIARGWITYFVDQGHDVHIISTYPCSSDAIPGAAIYQTALAFSGLSKVSHNGTVKNKQGRTLTTSVMASLRVGTFSGLTMSLRNWLGPIELLRHVDRVRDLIVTIAPDIVHACRIPFEGILAAKATPAHFPLLISVWGNDFTLFANQNPLIAMFTRKAMQRADALHSDCRRDLSLARDSWGFHERKPGIVLPGGIRTSCFNSESGHDSNLRHKLKLPEKVPVVFNPRGFRHYVRNDALFRAIPRVIKESDAVFVFSGMQSNPIAERWIRQESIEANVRLLPLLGHHEMADYFRLAQISVSPSEHDGTPNSLLEAMACGCFPIVGDIESVREWINDGENGLLCNPTSPESIAVSILAALKNEPLRTRAKEINRVLIDERAQYDIVMKRLNEFYVELIAQSGTGQDHVRH